MESHSISINSSKGWSSTMKTKLTLLTKLNTAALVAVAIALWTQWLSGDPAFPKFPPGPVIFIAIAGVVVFGARWWWTPMLGSLIALLTTSGTFVRMSAEILRLTHPGSVGKFAAGIFLGKLLQILGLLVADVTGLAATIQNFRRRGRTDDTAKMACRIFGGIFILMVILVSAGGLRADKYHNLMLLVWGVLAVGLSFMGQTVAKRFCIGSGIFYIALAMLGLLLGDSAMNRAWHFGPMLLHTGDHIFHLAVGFLFLGAGLISGREWGIGNVQHAGN
jgi:hypothetical protein